MQRERVVDLHQLGHLVLLEAHEALQRGGLLAGTAHAVHHVALLLLADEQNVEHFDLGRKTETTLRLEKCVIFRVEKTFLENCENVWISRSQDKPGTGKTRNASKASLILHHLGGPDQPVSLDWIPSKVSVQRVTKWCESCQVWICY